MSLFNCTKLSHVVFDPLSIEINQGEILVITGASGCGKSVFLRCLADIENHQGQVYLGDKEQIEFAPVIWRQQVGLLPAESQWWYPTVGQHFKEEPDYDIESSLEKFGFQKETLEWRVDRLSSGEKQRLALLRLLQNKPSVLLLDEPSSNLDAKMTLVCENLLCDYVSRDERAIIWVTHDLSQASRIASRVYDFEKKSFEQISASSEF